MEALAGDVVTTGVPPPGGQRSGRQRSGGPRSGGLPPGWQEAEVVEVIDEAPDAVTLRLRLATPRPFLPGQYYNARRYIPGRPRPVQRAYSVGSSPVPDPGLVDLGVKEVPGGLVSPGLVNDLGPGSRLEVRGPVGRFTWAGGTGPVLLVGAGSGMVPLMSMVRYAAATGSRAPMWLVCSAVSWDHAFYRDELGRLAGERPWLRVAQCVTRDPDERRADYHRRIDRQVLAETLDGGRPSCAYVCGPPAMVETVAAELARLGLPAEAVRSEKYD
ncbi:MAG: FAD-binding oxidoreductase [Acidimicrobiales bacterium]